VHPSRMRRGIGGRLVEAVLDHARAAGAPAVTLTTFRDVPWNAPWYERHGFVVWPERAWGPELRALVRRERELGIEVAPRVVMAVAVGSPGGGAVGSGGSWGGAEAGGSRAAACDRLYEVGGHLVDLDVAALGGAPQDVEGGRGGALAAGHDDAERLVDDRPSVERLAELGDDLVEAGCVEHGLEEHRGLAGGDGGGRAGLGQEAAGALRAEVAGG